MSNKNKPAAEAPEVTPEVVAETPAATEVVHSETVVVDNTDVEEVVEAAAEAEEIDLGTGTVMVSYR